MQQLIEDAVLDDFEAFVRGDRTVDRHAVFARCRAEAPVFRSEALDAWVVTRHADVREVIGDEDRFQTLREGPGAPVYGPSVLQWRGREHQRKGGIVAKRLRSPRAVREFDAFVAATADRLADDVVARSGPVDLKAEYAMWLPLLAIGELMAVEGADRFRDWYHDISAGGVSSIGHPETRARAFDALDELWAFLDPIIAERRRDPGDDLLSDLCTATYDDEPLPVAEIRSMAAFLLTAGVETTERALSSLLVHLFTTPSDWHALRADPSLVVPAIAESLRFLPPVQGLTRLAIDDVELHGVEIPAGDRFLALIASANRDDEVFEDPRSFRLDRFADDAERQFTNAGQILPFGAGRHHCTGSQLARLEMLHGLRALLARVESADFAVGGPPPPEGFLLVSPGSVEVTLRTGAR
ncbi:cytochrome P450 [Euzebya sp.]|uniref:cytochrome P450 n=1 Tax=Euzebya sp. TaxID=1971409 RepID=UPI003511BFF0